MNRKASRRVIARTVAAQLLAHPTERAHWIQALAAYLIETGRADEIDLVVNDIQRELFLQHGELVVDVRSARPLSDSVRRELTQLMQRETKATHVSLSESVDPSLLGGLVAKTADAQLDISVRSALQQLATIK